MYNVLVCKIYELQKPISLQGATPIRNKKYSSVFGAVKAKTGSILYEIRIICEFCACSFVSVPKHKHSQKVRFFVHPQILFVLHLMSTQKNVKILLLFTSKFCSFCMFIKLVFIHILYSTYLYTFHLANAVSLFNFSQLKGVSHEN